jgi:ribosomal protein S18 acetylase RimI-like enzyme
MIFETLMDGMKKEEVLFVNGGMCHWHLRKDGQITIYEIMVMPGFRGQGIGTSMIDRLKAINGATSIFVKCPADLPANGWYYHYGFSLEGEETTKSGRGLKLWRLSF